MRNDWIEIKLNKISTIETGKWDANHSVENGKYRFYTCAFEHLFCETKRFDDECLILPGNGANVGEVFYYNGSFDAYQRTYVISNISLNSKYLYYHLLCFWKHRNLYKQFGSATNYIRIGNFNEYIVDFPPLPEQKAIVAKIEQLFSDLDNGIANLKKTQEQLKIYRQAVLKKAFEGELTRSVEITWSKLDDVIKLIDGDRGKNYPKRNDYSDKGYCLFLSTKNVRSNGFKFDETVFINKEKHNQLRNGQLEYGDIVLTTRGTIGNVAYYNESVPFETVRINSGMLILRQQNEIFIPEFLTYYIQSPSFEIQRKKKKSGTAQPQLPAGILKNFVIPTPLREIQHQIVQEIETRLSVCDNVEANIKSALEKAESLRQSILKKAFEGKLLTKKELGEVRNNPEWEPAEKLLDKIKTEKAKLKNKEKGK